MIHAYQYQGFDIAVAIETDFSWKGVRGASATVGYVAIVRISKAGSGVALFSPLRLGESQGKPFISEIDALMSGYSAGRRVVDDLLIP
jgi:hypothetical protein